jgi:hypothetical protein
MEKINALIKPIALVFCIVVFVWLVKVTRYEHVYDTRGLVVRIDRLTDKVEWHSGDKDTWTTFGQ